MHKSFAMAWRSSGTTNQSLISNLVKNKLIKSDRVKDAMLKIDRAHYAPASPYEDCPQPIGHRATISAPHMHASACESLLDYLQPGSKVLDIGSGSGYLTAVLANLVAPNGFVIGIDHIQPLVDMEKKNMEKSEEGRRMLSSGQVKFVTGDGRKGWAEDAPYDAIHVGAAAAEHHESLTHQLKAPGRLFVPVQEDGLQYIFVIDKKEDGSLLRNRLYGVRYVPLTDAPV
ncbi:l-isoaspartate o-methyltransferase [Pyrenophora seminiperda CCB06]|uniref:Protein-L-isoaspartate O-methyltransferase n=1 Tax=Pyrenophora seminiperda CCB06 TaxID=1302712 RepID=A0A3M7M7B4_9PLEO|nr:l-isoaspartate o-methyltransferase [Pyrenophora seminiperda CCB06]